MRITLSQFSQQSVVIPDKNRHPRGNRALAQDIVMITRIAGAISRSAPIIADREDGLGIRFGESIPIGIKPSRFVNATVRFNVKELCFCCKSLVLLKFKIFIKIETRNFADVGRGCAGPFSDSPKR